MARTGARSAPLGVRRHTTDRHHPLIGYHRNATSARRARGRARTASSPFVAWPCTACATAAARVRDRDAWGRTPAGRLRTTLPRPCRARHALRDCATSRRGAPAPRSRRSFGLTKDCSCKLRSENPATVARREGGVSTARVPKRSGGLWTAGSGSVRTPRAARWSRARGRTSTRPRVCWAEACKASVHTPGQRRAKEGGDQRNRGVSWVQLSTRVVSAVLRRAVTSLEMSRVELRARGQRRC